MRTCSNGLRFWWLACLLLIWASLLLGGFFLGQTDSAAHQRIPTWARMASSLTLVVAAWSYYVVTPRGKMALVSALIALGMTLGFIGDVFMADLLPAPQPVLPGITAFALGHLAYIVAIWYLGRIMGLKIVLARWLTWFCWLIAGSVGWFLIAYPSSASGSLRWIALPYTLLLASTAGLATGLALEVRGFIPLALGGCLFFVSDLILAGQLFDRFEFYLINAAVWLTYGPGQMLIVYGANGAMTPLRRSNRKTGENLAH
jgi:hypothetical protein